jgi:uncharacterized protein YybS (DUF2232 family)
MYDLRVRGRFDRCKSYIVNRKCVNDLGKFLVVVGVVIAVVGVLLWTGVGKSWLGRLPGDIHYTKGDFSFHFPIVTCLLLSLLLTLILWLIRK